MRGEIIRLAWTVIGEQVLVMLTGMIDAALVGHLGAVIYGRFQSQAWKALKV